MAARFRAPAHGDRRIARGAWLGIVACLLATLVVSGRQALRLAFLNDDFVILDKVSRLSFLELWRPRELLFDWYRPWSRELHYWALLHVAGLREGVYHAVNLALWLAMALLYFDLVRRITRRPEVAGVATAGMAALTLWSAPLLWVAGVQDLWMLVFALCFLHAVARGRWIAAHAFLLLALLSKESAAVLPLVAFAYAVLDARTPWRVAVRRIVGLVAIVAVWAVLHPTLRARLFGAAQRSVEAEQRPGVLGTVARTLLAQVNLDAWPAPTEPWLTIVAKAAVIAALLVGVVLLARRCEPAGDDATGVPLPRVAVFGFAWAALGWGILLLPSIGWHAYYGSLGTLGCWLALGVLLARRRVAAIAAVIALVGLGQARASTRSLDWGTYWYMQRAGNFLGGIRARLFELHPTLPPGSRLYFARVPNDIGFLGGNGPAVRIWYGDPSLRAQFLSGYRPRAAADSSGRDYFFRFDMRDTLAEIVTGPESTLTRDVVTPDWRRNQVALATQFLRAGDVRAAAATYGRLSVAFPEHADYALFAASAYAAVGDSSAARRFDRIARGAMGDALVDERAPGLLRSAQEFLRAGQRPTGGPP